MAVEAKLKYLRVSARKARLVVNLIRGKKIAEARAVLDFTVKKSSTPIKKLLDSAVANAENNFKLKEKDLYIRKVFVDEGPTYKRVLPRSRGRADQIRKRSSHITLVLDNLENKNRK